MSRFLKGLPAQLILVTILPLTLVLSVVAFGGVYMHHQAMRTLISERDMRAVMATSEMLQRAIQKRSDGSLDLTAEQFSHLINPMANHRPVTAFLFDATGKLLLHTDASQIGSNISNHGGVAEALRGEHGVTYYTDNGESAEHIVSYAPIRLNTERYGLVIEEPWQEVIDPLMTYSLVAPLVLLPVMLLVAVGLMLGMRRIVRPLQQLQQQARNASAGNLVALAQPVDGIEEIEELQTTLQAMSQQIQSDQEQLHNYANQVIAVQEQERKRLAHDLHDDTIQSLIALSQRIQSTRVAMQRGKAVDVTKLDELRSDVLRMIEDVRRFSQALRPIYLEEAGLVAALERLVCEAHERGAQQNPPYHVSFVCIGDIARMKPETELTLFRIAQEALNNAIKHAHASRIELEIQMHHNHNRGVELILKDNGHGFDLGRVSSGMGILGIRERVASIGATHQLDSQIGIGTVLCVRLWP